MLTRPNSPGIWGIYTGAACFAGMTIATVVWNLIDHKADIRNWLKF